MTCPATEVIGGVDLPVEIHNHELIQQFQMLNDTAKKISEELTVIATALVEIKDLLKAPPEIVGIAVTPTT